MHKLEFLLGSHISYIIQDYKSLLSKVEDSCVKCVKIHLNAITDCMFRIANNSGYLGENAIDCTKFNQLYVLICFPYNEILLFLNF